MGYTLCVCHNINEPEEACLALSDIRQAFATVKDPRRKAGTRYPLSASLTLAVAAILCNQLSAPALAEWGCDLSLELKVALGFTKGKTPCQSTLHRLFTKLDPQALSTALTAYFDPAEAGPIPKAGSQGVAIAGKCQRGRLKSEKETA